MTSAKGLREQQVTELQQLLKELLHEQFNLRMQRGTHQLTQPSRMKAVRRQIARVKTVIHEKAIGHAA